MKSKRTLKNKKKRNYIIGTAKLVVETVSTNREKSHDTTYYCDSPESHKTLKHSDCKVELGSVVSVLKKNKYSFETSVEYRCIISFNKPPLVRFEK